MLPFIRKHPELLLFGMLTAMFSSPGQTFLVSLFIPHMQESFGMTKTEIAGLYSLATLISAGLLPWIGRVYDRSKLLKFALVTGLLLTAGCLVLSRSTGLISVLIGFFLIRNLGQGAMTMTSLTTMTRYFGPTRGKALGISNLGFPMAEAFFPIVVSSWILANGWRSGWVLLAAATLLRGSHRGRNGEFGRRLRAS